MKRTFRILACLILVFGFLYLIIELFTDPLFKDIECPLEQEEFTLDEFPQSLHLKSRDIKSCTTFKDSLGPPISYIYFNSNFLERNDTDIELTFTGMTGKYKSYTNDDLVFEAKTFSPLKKTARGDFLIYDEQSLSPLDNFIYYKKNKKGVPINPEEVFVKYDDDKNIEIVIRCGFTHSRHDCHVDEREVFYRLFYKYYVSRDSLENIEEIDSKVSQFISGVIKK